VLHLHTQEYATGTCRSTTHSAYRQHLTEYTGRVSEYIGKVSECIDRVSEYKRVVSEYTVGVYVYK